MKRSYLLVLFALSLASGSFGQNINKPATSKTGVAQRGNLAGVWKIIEFSDFDSLTGTWKDRYGRQPRGYFVYAQNGILVISISTGDPVIVSEDSAKNMTVNYHKAFVNNAFSYFGTYTVDWEKSILTHKVKGGSILWYIDTDQYRPFRLKGDTLTLGDNKTSRRVLVRTK